MRHLNMLILLLFVVSVLTVSGCDDSGIRDLFTGSDNAIPVADAGGDQEVYTASTVNLIGSGSYDDDGDGLTYSWTIVSAPQGSAASLSNANYAIASIIPDVDGTYIIQLIVNDGEDSSDADTVTISAIALGGNAETTVYTEDFSSDPNFTVVSSRPEDELGWVSSGGYYRVYFPTDDDGISTYSQSGQIGELSNESFSLSIDINAPSMSWGQQMHFGFGSSWGEHNSISVGHNNGGIFFSYGGGVSSGQYVWGISEGVWYRHKLSYDQSTGQMQWTVTDLNTNSVIADQTFPASPLDISQLYFGNTLAYGEGQSAELWFDNITINAPSEGITLFFDDFEATALDLSKWEFVQEDGYYHKGCDSGISYVNVYEGAGDLILKASDLGCPTHGNPYIKTTTVMDAETATIDTDVYINTEGGNQGRVSIELLDVDGLRIGIVHLQMIYLSSDYPVIWNDGSANVATTFALPLDVWHHVKGIFNATTKTFILDIDNGAFTQTFSTNMSAGNLGSATLYASKQYYQYTNAYFDNFKISN